ncbi:FAD:protein FMN transferase [Devosia beringensis]|uniref:FAD:protein FMN transferase n=1 Tax=Devosia beringensis TaxID=2657486 RepID=UPI00186B8037|nr:FAD:protein FMN transferase [Devosia beringensis]
MSLTRRRLLLGAAATLLFPALPGLADELRLSGRAYGTSWQVRLPRTGDVTALAHDLKTLLDRVDAAMSPFRPDSAISRFNRAPAGWHDVDPDLAHVTTEALRLAALTSGAFDPSVGPDVGRYGFGPITGTRTGSFADFAVTGTTIYKAKSDLTLDLCGIAKGYALDLMAATIAEAGYPAFVAELGGEVIARGADPTGAPWRIGISDPLGGPLRALVDTDGLALATSGDAINAYEVAGRRYSHIIDPLTDEPLRNAVASVSVFAPSAMTADALATALMVMGTDSGLRFADDHALAVLYFDRVPGGLRAAGSRAYAHHVSR